MRRFLSLSCATSKAGLGWFPNVRSFLLVPHIIFYLYQGGDATLMLLYLVITSYRRNLPEPKTGI